MVWREPMLIIDRPEQVNLSDTYVDLNKVIDLPVLLKIEQLNLAGSIKLKTARALVDEAEESGSLATGGLMVTSSSGNLGIAIAAIAAGRCYKFHCVTDARCNAVSIRQMESFGAQVEIVTEAHPTGGLLQARIERVAEIVATNPGAVLIDQYQSPANPAAHERTTGQELLTDLPDLRVLFIGVGTSGTIMGVARAVRKKAPHVQLVGVDSVGSVSFGGPASPRYIPGLGSGVIPAQLDMSLLDDHLYVPEEDMILACREMASNGFLFGGSTGTVIAGARNWLSDHGYLRDGELTVGSRTFAAIAPDGGERYLESVYSDGWVQDLWPTLAIATKHDLSRENRRSAEEDGMMSSILEAASKSMGKDVGTQSWYIQGGTSMQATQLISSLRSLGVSNASMADLLEADNVREYLISLDQEVETSGLAQKMVTRSPKTNSDISNVATPLLQDAERGSSSDAERSSIREKTYGAQRSNQITSPIEGSEMNTSLGHNSSLGSEATFLLKGASQSGLDGLISLMDACRHARADNGGL